jgi:hypothetical protein
MQIASISEGAVGREALKRELAKFLGRDRPLSDRTITRFEQQGLPVRRLGHLRIYEIEQARAWLLGRQRPRTRAQR